MEAEHYMDNFDTVKHGHKQVVCEQGYELSSAISGEQCLKQKSPVQVERLDDQVVGLSLQEHSIPSSRVRSIGAPQQSQG
nr:hypothetical protein CFP56_00060 [Quercus suber]